jgi:hypothetical protein
MINQRGIMQHTMQSITNRSLFHAFKLSTALVNPFHIAALQSRNSVLRSLHSVPTPNNSPETRQNNSSPQQNSAESEAETAFVGPNSPQSRRLIRRIESPGSSENLPVDPGAIHAENLLAAAKLVISPEAASTAVGGVADNLLQGVIVSRGLDRCPSPYAPGTNPYDNLPPPALPLFPEPDSTVEGPIYNYPRAPYTIYQDYINRNNEIVRRSYNSPELLTTGRRFYNVFTYTAAGLTGLYWLLEAGEQEREEKQKKDVATPIRERWKKFKKNSREWVKNLLTPA